MIQITSWPRFLAFLLFGLLFLACFGMMVMSGLHW